MKQELQYAAHYPESLDPNDPDWGNVWATRKRESLDDAEGLVRYINSRAKAGGFPERAYVVERVVLVGEWEPISADDAPKGRGGIEE